MNLIEQVVSWLPPLDPNVTDTIDEGLATFIAGLGQVGWWFPVSQFITLFQIFIFTEIFLFFWRIYKFVAWIALILFLITHFNAILKLLAIPIVGFINIFK